MDFHKNENEARQFLDDNSVKYSNLETCLEDVVVLQNRKIRALKVYIADLECEYIAMAEKCDDYKEWLDNKENEIEKLKNKIKKLKKGIKG